MTRILLVRHGETEFNTAQRFQGVSDIELNTAGYRQVEKLRDRLEAERIDTVYSSDMKRALATAEIISSRHKADVIKCSELRETNYGELEGLTFDEICRLYTEIADLCVKWSPQLQFPGGESFDEVKLRVGKFVNRLKKHTPEQTVLVVAHGGPLRLLLCYLLELDSWHWRQFPLNLASLSMVETYPDIALVTLLNDTHHLKQKE